MSIASLSTMGVNLLELVPGLESEDVLSNVFVNVNGGKNYFGTDSVLIKDISTAFLA